MKKAFNPRVFKLKEKRYFETVKFSDDTFEYLDSILKILALNLGSNVPEDLLIIQVKHPKDYKNRQLTVLRTSTSYLRDKSLIYKLKDEKGQYNYMIAFEGMVVLERGGLLKSAKREQYKERLQKLVWIAALLTFAVNTIFQVINYFTSCSKTTTQKENTK